MDVYQRLADRLNALPHGYPPTADGTELRLLRYLYTEEEADLAAELRLTFESASQIAERLGREKQEARTLLKQMTKKGLIDSTRIDGGFGYALLPFVVGIYELQVTTIDEELSRLFEDYYQQSLGQMLTRIPQAHRVLPVNESIPTDLSIEPYENVVEIIKSMESWGVYNCICRQQQALIGNPCEHPQDVCMIFSERPGAFSQSQTLRELTMEEALETVKRAADAGLIHSTSNNQNGLWYLCNCCTCSCGMLRGISELGIVNAVATSSLINQIDPELCSGCENCIEYCQFEALLLDDDGIITVDSLRCLGCGVCVPHCDMLALGLIKREEFPIPPKTERDWTEERARQLGLDLSELR